MEELKKGDENNAGLSAQEIEEENKRLEEALKKREELYLKEENLRLKSRLGGKSEAGVPAKSEEEISREKIEAEAERIKGALFLKKK